MERGITERGQFLREEKRGKEGRREGGREKA